MNRSRLILFILVIVFAGVVLWSYSAIPRLKTVDTSTVKPVVRVAPVPPTNKPARTVDDGTILNLALLDSEPAGFSGYRRNIFKPFFADEMKAAKQKTVVMKPPPPPMPIAPVQPVVVQPEAAPLARFTFLGFLKKGAVKTIFLANEKDIILVKQGDKIAGRYEATEISDEALTLTVVDSGDEIVIPLIENRPLVKK